MKLFSKWLLLALGIVFLVWLFGYNYSFVFKKKVVGVVVAAEKVNVPVAMIAGDLTQPVAPSTVFSFSVGIKDRHSGEIYMASSEDRQWAAAQVGNCVIAAYFPYPPWEFAKGGTSHNARLLRNFTDCDQLPKENWFDDLKFFLLLN